MVISAIIALVAIIGALISPVYTKLGSETKRLDDRITANDNQTAEVQRQAFDIANKFAAHVSESTSSFKEIETQFDADNQLRNVQFSDLQRTVSVMWNHIDGLGSYPTGPFFQPNISNRK